MSKVSSTSGSLEDITTTAAVISSALSTAAEEGPEDVELPPQNLLQTHGDHLVSSVGGGANDEGNNHDIAPPIPSEHSSMFFLSMGGDQPTSGGGEGSGARENSEQFPCDNHDNRGGPEKLATPPKRAVFQPSSKVIELPEKKPEPPHHHHHHHHRKESKIPVGIAVAWQRLVTTTTTTTTTVNAMTTKAEGGVPSKKKHHHHHHLNDQPPPHRPSSASPVGHKGNPKPQHHHESKNNGYPTSGGESEVGQRPLSACGDGGLGLPPNFCPSASPVLSRPLPSSSVPPNLGYPGGGMMSPYQYPPHQFAPHQRESPYYPAYHHHHHRSFVVPSPISSPQPQAHHHHPYGNGHYWGGGSIATSGAPLDNPCVPLLSPGMPTAGDYLLSSMQQMHFQHLLARGHVPPSPSPVSPPTSGGAYPHHHNPYFGAYQTPLMDPPKGGNYYESSPYHHGPVPPQPPEPPHVPPPIQHEVERKKSSCDNLEAIPPKSEERRIPRISPPPPSTAVSEGGGGPPTTTTSEVVSSASSPSPSFLLLHQHQHPHLFTTSAALSPKSLTSSTPSPVTVHDFNSGSNVVVAPTTSGGMSYTTVQSLRRGGATPSPVSVLTVSRGLLSPFGSPFSPGGGPSTSKSKEELVENGSSSLTSTPASSPLSLRRKQLVATPLSSPSQQQRLNDFKRLESLIERRDCESISPLVLIPQHSPATSTSSSASTTTGTTAGGEVVPSEVFVVKVESEEPPTSGGETKVEESKAVQVSVKTEKIEEDGGNLEGTEGRRECDETRVPEITLATSDKTPPVELLQTSFTSGYSSSHDVSLPEEMEVNLAKNDQTIVASPPKKAKVKKEKKDKVKDGGISKKKKERGGKLEGKMTKKEKLKEVALMVEGTFVKTEKKQKGKKKEVVVDSCGGKKVKADKVKVAKDKRKTEQDKRGDGEKRKKNEEKKKKKANDPPKLPPPQVVMTNGGGDERSLIRMTPSVPPPPVTTYILSPNHYSPSNPPAVVSNPSNSQVTFFITSPPPQDVGTLRIPAYIPRNSGPPPEPWSLGGGDEFETGPTTLTLHRDVIESSQSTTSNFQTPPAITIQYHHHSAPATPSATCRSSTCSSLDSGGSPPYSSLNQLDLLATVAQEFGSREDIGKRLSVDGGGTSCGSSFGESPPMSPQKYSYHPPPPPPIPVSLPRLPQTITTTSGGSKEKKKGLSVRKMTDKATKKDRKISKLKGSSKPGKKQKRSVSDSSAYQPPPPPVFLLKIPHVVPKPRGEKKKKMEGGKKEEKVRSKERKKSEKKQKKNLEGILEEIGGKVKKKKEKKATARLVTPLKLQISGGGNGGPTTPNFKGKKGGVLSAERISAFAKQVIARRDSSVGTTPTKVSPPQVAAPNSEEQRFHFFPVVKRETSMEEAGSLIGDSPPLRMPRLTPYDLPEVATKLEVVPEEGKEGIGDKTDLFSDRNRSPSLKAERPKSLEVGQHNHLQENVGPPPPPSPPRRLSFGSNRLSAFSPLTPPLTAKTPEILEEKRSNSRASMSSRCSSSCSSSSNSSGGNDAEVDTTDDEQNEADFRNNWVADPMFAVSAIKISTSNRPSSNSSNGNPDDDEDEPKRKRMSLLSSKKKVEEGEEDGGRRRFLEMKSQLKAFVHFKPKQVHQIKPCLKAEPVVRSHEGEPRGEEDEDFELDLEVASFTTKTTKPWRRASEVETAATSIPKKIPKRIDRNSANYSVSTTSTSGGKKASTKEIMSRVFSRKVSPDMLLHDSTSSPTKRRRKSGGGNKNEGTDDEDEDTRRKSPTTSMSALAAAVVVNPTSGGGLKSPKKRTSSTRLSSTTSSVTSERGKRQSRGSSVTSTSVPGGGVNDETLLPGKVALDSVAELVDEMRILTDIQGLFYTGRLNALQPPDVYGVTLDNERGAPPHLIFSAEEVLEKCLREKKLQTLSSGLRVCAYWSPQYSGLYPGRVSSEFNPKFDPETDRIPIEFDDGDTRMIKLKEIRLLSTNHPVREYDPNPLLTLEKKHRKRRHSSATGTSVGGCTGDHEETDCGESYCAKVGKLEDDDDDEDEDDEDEDKRFGGRRGQTKSFSKVLYWTWSGLGFKRSKSKKDRNKEFFHGIQRGDTEFINVGDAALFISTGNERPFIGRVERFWEKKGKKMVNVRWFYHPEEVKASSKRLSNLKYPGALFESPHIDENDVQTIAKKCDVLPFPDFKQRLARPSASSSLRLAKLSTSSPKSKPRDMYYVAGFYDPYTYNLTLKDLK